MQKGLPHGRPLLNRCLTVSYSRMANATLPSALPRFTSEFGMGSGGSTALLPPGKNLQSVKADVSNSFVFATSLRTLLGCCMVKPHG